MKKMLCMRPGAARRRWALSFIRQLVDDLIYNEHGNEVLLIKYMDPK
jgi:hypothetical protein